MKSESLIRQQRRRNLLTQAELAAKLGYHWQTLAQVEQRRRTASLAFRAAWTGELGGRVEDYFDGNGFAK